MITEIKLSYSSIQNIDFYYILRKSKIIYNNRNKEQIEIINEFFEIYGNEKDPDFLYYKDLNAFYLMNNLLVMNEINLQVNFSIYMLN